jgi:hypothetical protein
VSSAARPLELAKQCLDVGLYTDRTSETLAFYQDGFGLPYEELLKVAKGSRQHRLGLRGSVLKVNETRDPLAPAPSGFRRLLIADDRATSSQRLDDPQGVAVERVVPGTGEVTAIGIVMGVADVAAQVRFLTEGLGGRLLGPGHVRIGTTVIVVEEDPAAPARVERHALGFRYATIQVHDVAAAHAHVVGLGFAEGLAPVRLGDTAAISFVLDAGSNWWEISQRANLTGPLPQL